MRNLDLLLRKWACEDAYIGGGFTCPRTGIGKLFRYIYLWTLLPLWGPLALLGLALHRLGESLEDE
jgi:hypothetical protein